MEHLLHLIDQFGYVALYGLLALGIVGIPIPDEILMTTVGTLTIGHDPVMSFVPALLVSFAGAMTGMSVSYAIGRRVGKPFLYRHAKKIKLTPEKLASAERWFDKYGLWAVAFGYYVPGLRHLTCYLSGVSNVKLGRYLLFAGIGGFIWCTTFLALGHFIGRKAYFLLRHLHHYTAPILVVLAVLAICYYLFWRYRRQRFRRTDT
ncbi:DedA family protein [Paenibacillus sp. YYML68]|uniref:DedA family protein n=1 Tax=Paenibacillus sp. YYML68 TaxID=2909250 RepID=UPI002492D9D2|nr:DedA family protein [Paenibacillus sp. YYML68]